jgi:hypothetical protein
MHKEIDRKEKRVYGGGMSTAAIENKNSFEQFAQNTWGALTGNWVNFPQEAAKKIQEGWTNFWKEAPGKAIAAPGNAVKIIYRLEEWAGSGLDYIKGIALNSGSSALAAFSTGKVQEDLKKFIITAMSAAVITGKGALQFATQTLFNAKKGAQNAASFAKGGADNAKKVAATTAAAMNSGLSNFAHGVKDTLHTLADWAQALVLSGQDPRTA